MKNIYPRLYLNSVQEISVELLEEYHLKGLILDVDNTLIDYDRKMPEGVKQWVQQLKKAGISLCIVSNTNQKDKVEEVAKKLDLPYIFFAKKPLKGGFKKAKKLLNLNSEQIGVVGDQIMTDVLGANRSQMFPILVKPISKRDFWITKIKRPIESRIISTYEQREKQIQRDDLQK